MIPIPNDYVKKRSATFLSMKNEESDDQPLDFSIGKQFRDSPDPCSNYGLADTHPKTPASPKSPTMNYYSPIYPFLGESPENPKSPKRMRYNNPLRPKSPAKNSFHNNSRTSESGISSGSISPERSSPSQFPSNYFNPINMAGYSDRNGYSGFWPQENDTNALNHRGMFSMMGAPMTHPILGQPINRLAQTVPNEILARNSIALMLGLGKLPNYGPANLSVPPYIPPVDPNSMSVAQEHNFNCAQILQEKFHIPPSEMPKIPTSHFEGAESVEEMNLISNINYRKFRDEIMSKKRDENPSKSRRTAARSTPYSLVRTDLTDESLDTNGESQGESMETEVDPRKRQYQEKRRKNNEAAKKSRDQRKSREEETAIVATFYQHENKHLYKILAFFKTVVPIMVANAAMQGQI